MANNPYVSKVQYGNSVLIDLTSDTVVANKMLAGYTAHDKSGAAITGNIASKAAETITPTTSDIVISSGQYLSGAQTVKGDANLIPENIAKDVTIFGVTGTHEGGGGARLPAEYQEVEYIQTDGNAYIDTGYIFSGIARFELKAYRPNVTSYHLFGASENNGAKRFMLGSTGNSNILLYGSAASNYTSTAISYIDDARNKDNIYYGTILAGHISILDTKEFYGSTSGTTVNMPLSASSYFLAQNYNGSARNGNNGARGYYLKIWDGANYTLVRDLVPCYRKVDNVIGMYDLAASGGTVFYANAGSGAFTKGANV